MNLTIDDSSPRIRYYSTFTNGTRNWSRASSSDSATDQSFGKTLTSTSGEGDRMVLTLNGSDVWVYGSRAFDHGAFSSSIDNGEPIMQIGTFGTRLLQNLLFSAIGLNTSQEHTVTLTNLPSESTLRGGLVSYYLDIDYIIVQMPTNGTMVTTSIDDASLRMRYSGDWAKLKLNGTTSHLSTALGDTATLAFTGTSVEAIGTLSSNRGNYTVSVDGVNQGMYSGRSPESLPNTSIFSITGLEDAQHTITLTNIGGTSGGNFFDLDRMIYNSTLKSDTSDDATPTPSPSPVPGNTSNSNHFESPAVITGGIIGALAIVLMGGLGGWWMWSRRRNQWRKRRSTARIDLTGDEVKPFEQPRPTPSAQIGDNWISPIPITASDSHFTPPHLSIPCPPLSTTSSFPQAPIGGSHEESTQNTTVAIGGNSTLLPLPRDNKSLSAVSMINTLRMAPVVEAPVVEVVEGSQGPARRVNEEEALFRSGRADEEPDVMPPPYA